MQKLKFFVRRAAALNWLWFNGNNENPLFFSPQKCWTKGKCGTFRSVADFPGNSLAHIAKIMVTGF